MATSNWFQQVLEDVKNASIKPPSTKQEAIEYFQREYTGRGQAGWKQQLVHRLSLITGLKPKSLEKRFDSGSKGGKEPRINKPEPKNAAQYKELGVLIGIKPPKNGYHVHYDGWVLFSNTCSHRTFDVDITGEWAKQVSLNPPLVFPAMFLIYMEEDNQDRDIDEQDPSVGFCEHGDEGEAGEEVENPNITISANEREVSSGHSGQRRRFSFFS